MIKTKVNKMDILIPEDIKGQGIDRLSENYKVVIKINLYKDIPKLQEEISQTRAIIIRNLTILSSETINNARRLQVIGRMGVGLDNIDLKAASEKGIVVCSATDENACSVSEFTLAMMLCLAKKIVTADRSVRKGNWDRMSYIGSELFGKTLGILGLGRIGYRVALRARSFGMKILAYDRFVSPHSLVVTECGAMLTSLHTVLRESDVITIHLPLTDDTEGLINATTLRKMKKNVLIINMARGKIIVEEDLCYALKEKKIAGAALDVRENEPPGNSQLHGFENVILTPHIGGFTNEALEKVVNSVADDVDRILSGKSAINFVNFPNYKRS